MARKCRLLGAILVRVIFITHVALLRYYMIRFDLWHWCLNIPLYLLSSEGALVLILGDKWNKSWYSPSMFFYIIGIGAPTILLELVYVQKLAYRDGGQLKDICSVEAPYKISLSVLGELFFNDGTMVTLLEHLSMPILVFGKCVLLKGDVTRDQRSLLLLVYTGTAADIIQFCELFRDPKVGSHNLLPIIAIFIWAFSIMQFPIVEMVTTDLRPNTIDSDIKRSEHCLIEGWTIVIHTALQDAPFLAFRILVITHIRVISYMNFFFTCKNILVILFNAHRLFAIYGEQKKDKAMNLGIFPSSSKYIQAKKLADRQTPRRSKLASNSKINGESRRKWRQRPTDRQKTQPQRSCNIPV